MGEFFDNTDQTLRLDGVDIAGDITYTRLLGLIRRLVMRLACINFMNPSTARSEKRTPKVAIRKTIASLYSRQITQFFTESITSFILIIGEIITFKQIQYSKNRVAVITGTG